MRFLGFIITFLTAFGITQYTVAQNGEELFNVKCGACHTLGKTSVGPDLKGAKQKWTDSNESELLYLWVTNPAELIASGTSSMAEAIKDFSATDMTPQEMTNEEIDAVFAYIDSYEPPVAVEEPETVDKAEPVVVYVPNYKKNLTLFYFLLLGVLIQLIAILMLTAATKTMVTIEKMKSAAKGNSTIKSVLLVVGVFATMAATNFASAFSFVSTGVDPEMPWLLVEDSDLIVLLCINVAMLFLVFHFRGMFMEIAKMVRPPKEEVVSEVKHRGVNAILTDAVPIEEEHTILMHHEYDGIRELDNNLPPWWVWGFVATIIFAFIYLFNYHVFQTGDLQIAEYNKAMAQADTEVKAYLDQMAMNVDASNVTLMTEKSDLSIGKTLFETNCISCHNMDGAGNAIGPNLTDKAWIYGYEIAEIFTSVKEGRPNGMPEHSSKFNPIQLQQVASYVVSLPEVEGKDAQGDILEK